MALLILYLTLAIAVSFLCSVLEAVILSVSGSFIEIKEQEGRAAATKLKKYKAQIDRPLSAILSLNTVAHTIGAAGVGAQAVQVFGEAYFGLISAVLTLLILIFSEIIPKTIGARFWRQLCLPAVPILSAMIVIAYPLVYISEAVGKLIAGSHKMPTVSREEIAVLTHIGTQEGVFEEKESKVIRNMIRLKDIHIRSIMTPRTVLISAEEELSLEAFFNDTRLMQHSRIPLYQKDTDNIAGYVLKYDVLINYARGKKEMQLKQLKRDIIVSYENFNIAELFETLVKAKEHISIVVDEYGSVVGMATMEDIIETMLGLEILDEKDKQVDMQELAKEKWNLRARKLKLRGQFASYDNNASAKKED